MTLTTIIQEIEKMNKLIDLLGENILKIILYRVVRYINDDIITLIKSKEEQLHHHIADGTCKRCGKEWNDCFIYECVESKDDTVVKSGK